MIISFHGNRRAQNSDSRKNRLKNFQVFSIEEDGIVKDWMNTGIISTTGDESIESIAKVMRDLKIGSLVVVNEEDIPTGIITSSDIISKVVAEDLSPHSVLVDDVMCRDIKIARYDEQVSIVAKRLIDNNIQKMPIVDEKKRLVGIITTTDICRFCAKEPIKR